MSQAHVAHVTVLDTTYFNKKMKLLMYCCGFNGFGQLKQTGDTFLEELTSLPIENASEITFSWSNLYVRTTAGEVFVFGQIKEQSGEISQLTFEDEKNTDYDTNRIKHISCSFFRKQALFVTEPGICYMVGGDVNPQTKRLADFTRVESNNLDEHHDGNKIIKVCCGGYYTNLALLSSRDTLYCIPSIVPLSGIRVQEIACGFEHNLLLTDNGEVYSWGAGSRGQLGLSTLDDVETPTRVPLSSATHIAAGGWHSFVRTTDNVLFTWGWNSHGQLGFPTAKTEKENSVNVAADPISVPFTSDKPLTGLACGNKHTVLVFDNRSVWVCGWNGYGQLGKTPKDLETCERLTEMEVPSGKIRKVFAGGWNTGLLIEREDNE